VYDLREGNDSKEKLYALSDSMDEDLLAITVVKGGKKVLCSSQEGVIFLFKWDWFGDCADRLLGHPNSIDAMIKIDENTVITGSEDGFLRAVGIGPNQILSLLGQHNESEDIQPITRIAQARQSHILATCSHDSAIKFHNIDKFLNKRKTMTVTEEEIEMEGSEDEENEEDMEDMDDEEEEVEVKKEIKFPKKTTVKQRTKEIEKDHKKKFFSNL